MKAPRCRLCKTRHWSLVDCPEPVTASVTIRPDVTSPVTLPATMGTFVTGGVTPSHRCPVCGLMHQPGRSNAERQRAYRARQAEVT